ncbi:hypothetical protein C5167_005505 [Papaver somniferum]|uniref:Uncharacterized protein n=1 Tax=Papaver somniferum TaxID=3469 RepID=A0A4Y7JBK9_PAPSO|nr:hypothetical protein C5167_005505 [Papaver somniferum]
MIESLMAEIHFAVDPHNSSKKQADAKVCEIDPSIFRDCDALVRNLHGRSEILAVSVHFERIPMLTTLMIMRTSMNQVITLQFNDGAEKRSAEVEVVEVKQSKCSTRNALVGDVKQRREHFKSKWHKQI